MDRTIGKFATAGFVFALAVLVINAWVSYRNLSELREGADWVDHTYRVISALDGLVRVVSDTETAPRFPTDR